MLINKIDKSKPIHMIGIGGVSMSGIAEIIANMGFKVTGSDSALSTTTEKLAAHGITVFEGHKEENVIGASIVVYTAAVKEDNPELINARALGIPCMERSEFLGELTKLYKRTICISGTHGKTTTTSMTSLEFIEDGKDPSIQVGADLRALDNENFRAGNSDYFIIESCEYVRSFLQFHPHTAVILNIEEDHLDYYKDLEDIKSAFRDFANLVPSDGFVVYNLDDANTINVVKDTKAKLVSIGINNKSADFVAENIKIQDNGCYSFDVVYGDTRKEILLNVLGYHNIYNALASIAASINYGLDISNVIKGLGKFTGASRRFEHVGKINGASIYDDYAHHPTEIKATLASASTLPHGKVIAIFQPHTYSRTKTLFNEFATAFDKADEVILIDIYAAREKDTLGISSKLLAQEISKTHPNCKYLGTLEDAAQYLKEHISSNDLVLTIGAGTITKLGYMLIK